MTGLPPEGRHEPLACLFCGEPEQFEISEIYEDHAFDVDCCCEGLREQVLADVAADPAWGRELMRRAGAELLTGQTLRRLADDGMGSLILDWQLRLRPITFAAARAFVGRHHEHCGPPAAWRWGCAAVNGWTTVGVVMAGNPVARAYAGRGIVEVNRLCTRRDLPAALRWNACSLLYGWSASQARKYGFAKIITYVREDESATSLVAAGWTREGRAGGGSWHRSRRRRLNRNDFVPKLRWSRTFPERPAPRPRPAPPPPPPPLALEADDWRESLFLGL